ncbi:papain-like cysteine protease family protein [Aureimonas ureilytica]|uniref:papain-like cysteine protease family protein n=1 Tax=Aureimonas ureilytica TaxID=401562 RepID=UPI000364C729|nr:papain-like cysteine protease family protein [Aureimonas ureilytica]
MVQLKIGAAIFNKRAKASTASNMPSLPINNASDKYSPSNRDEMFPYIILPIEFQAQKHINMCGDACVNMLYAYHGKTPPNNLNINLRGVFEGMDNSDIVEKFGTNKGGSLTRWRPSWRKDGENFSGLNPMRLAAGLHKCGPLMWSGEFARFLGNRWGHWIIVHGIVEETVLIADPWHGQERKKPFSWFAKHMSKDPKELPFYIA